MRLGQISPQNMGLVIMAVSVLILGIWMQLAPLHGAVVSIGLVKAAHNRKLVQHTDGGIVKRILVKNGDSVSSGQPLLELEDIKSDSSHQLLSELLVFEEVKRDRLDAEQQLMPRFVLGAGIGKLADRELVSKAHQRELRIFQTRRNLLDEQLASYQRQLVAIAAEQQALRLQAEASRNAARLAKDELQINEGLVRENFISRARLLALERALAEYGAKLGEHEAQLAQSEQRKNDTALRMASTRSEYQRIAAEDFKETSARLVQLREQLRPLEDAVRRKIVTAPAGGKVVGLRLNAPGEVAPPREPLMEIVPDNEELVVEARVGVDAIRHLRIGQKTELRFTTYSSRSTPLVLGELTYLAPDVQADKDGLPYYAIQIRPQPDSLRQAGIPALQPGMGAEVYVLLESRRVIDYLLTPITDSLRRALREP